MGRFSYIFVLDRVEVVARVGFCCSFDLERAQEEYGAISGVFCW